MMQHLTRGASGSDGLPNQWIGIALTACGMRADLRSHSWLRSFSGMFGNRGEGLALLRGEELVGLIGHVKRSVRLHCSVLHVATGESTPPHVAFSWSTQNADIMPSPVAPRVTLRLPTILTNE